MKITLVLVAACLIAAPLAHPAFAQSKWSLGGDAGISVGDRTDASFAWWTSLHHWVTPTLGLGIEGGRHRWAPNSGDGIVIPLGIGSSFNTLARGGQELQHLSGSVRFRANRVAGSAPVFTLGVGAYRQVIRHSELPSGTDDPRDGMVRLGWSMALGGVGGNAIAPGAEFRFDLVDTQPAPTTYFTAAFGLHLNH